MLHCAILGGMINVDVYLWERKEVFWSAVRPCFPTHVQPSQVGAVPFGSSGTSQQGLLCGSTGEGESHFWRGSLLLGEGNSCV